MLTMTRDEFLQWRNRQVKEAAEYAKSNPSVIVSQDPEDDEIVCDVCNCTVTEERVFFNDWGLYCPDCRVKHQVGIP